MSRAKHLDTKPLVAALLIYAFASLFHHVHNASFLAVYPNLPPQPIGAERLRGMGSRHDDRRRRFRSIALAVHRARVARIRNLWRLRLGWSCALHRCGFLFAHAHDARVHLDGSRERHRAHLLGRRDRGAREADRRVAE